MSISQVQLATATIEDAEDAASDQKNLTGRRSVLILGFAQGRQKYSTRNKFWEASVALLPPIFHG
jgi:hypothetical protein